jgi:anaerobic selenocysteine-containing dehydrogenase
MIITVKDGIINRVRGDPEHPGSRGKLCPKAAAVKDLVYSPQRLRKPLAKRKDDFEPVSWELALDLIAEKLMEIKGKYGAETLFLNRGAPVTQEVHDAFTQLMAAYGSPNSTGPSHLCHWPIEIGMKLVCGRNASADFPNTKCIIIWAANPTESTRLGEGIFFGRYDKVIQEAKKKGATLIVIDPFRTPVASIADKWLQIWPGTDAALGLAMLHTIINENLYDKEFVDKRAVGFEELKAHVQKFTPEWAAVITGIPAHAIGWLARTYATTKPACILLGNGFEGHPNSVQSTQIVAILMAVTGNVDIPGGNVFFPEARLSRYPTIRPGVKPLGAEQYPLFPRVPFPAFMDACLSGKPYQPRAMIVYHANPLLINANEKKIREALQKLEFLVVFDLFKTATAEMAHVILPAASCFERDGFRIYSSPEGAFTALRRRVVDPIPECRSWTDVEYELAKRMGLEDTYPWKTAKEWIDFRLKPLEITVDQLERRQFLYVTPPVQYNKHLKDGFATPSGKIELYSEKAKNSGYEPLPVYREPPESLAARPGQESKFPLIGTTRRPGVYVHTRFRNMPGLRKLEPEACVRIHPEDARQRGIAEGNEVLVESKTGTITLTAKVTEETMPGLVVIDFGWGNPGDGGANVNVLTSDEARDPISATTSNRRFLCQVRKL